jgi:hypothetical protein
MGVAMKKIQVTIHGASVIGGGIATHYFADAVTPVQGAVKTFWDTVSNYMPTAVSIDVPNFGDIIEDTSGEITGSWTDGTAGGFAGGGTNTFASGVGARVVWETGGIRKGRHVRGSTYIVPTTYDAYTSGGGLVGAEYQATVNAAIATLLTAAPSLCVWSRPTPGTEDGIHSVVLAGHLSPQVSWLRSRRT